MARFDRVIHVAKINVRGQHRYLHSPAFRDGGDDLLGVVDVGVQQRRHVLGGIVGLQVGGPVRDYSVADRVRFVEGVSGEGLDERKDSFGKLLLVALLQRARNEILLLLRHDRGDLLAHGLSDDIGFAQGIACDGAEYMQHLVLIDDDAVGLLQDVLQVRMRVLSLIAPVLGLDERGDVLHGARPV